MKTLVKNKYNRWCVVENELNCGNSIFVYTPLNGWQLGRIEYSDKAHDYIFYCETLNKALLLNEDIEVRTVADQIALEIQADGFSITERKFK